MAEPKTRIWSNWSGRVTASPANFWTPGSEAEIAEGLPKAEGVVRPAGSGHSFTELCATPGTIVSLTNMTGLIEADPETGEAEFWAGTPVYAVGPLLHPFGLALANQGDIDRQTLAGAIGTGTHGTGPGFGSLSSMVTALTLVTAAGEILRLSPEATPDLFEAGRLSLGALGIVTRIRLRVVPAFALVAGGEVRPAREVLDRLGELAAAHRHFEFFWFPHDDRLVVKTLDVAEAVPERTLDADPMRARGDTVTAADRVFGAIGHAVRHLPSSSRFFNRLLTSRMADGEAAGGRVRWSWQAFSSARSVRFNEMEYAVPAERAAEAVEAVVRRIRKDRLATAFPIEFRFVKGDDIWLSPFHGRDSATISVHQHASTDQQPLFAACEEELLAFQGRPHWGKQHNLTGREFLWLYPQWRRFREARTRLDPRGVFLSPYLRTLLESGTEAVAGNHTSKY